MKLFTNQQKAKLTHNGSHSQRGKDPIRVVKLITADAGCTWLLTELDAFNEDFVFGLCDLGFGFPELGYVSISELISVRGYLGLPVERDRHVDVNCTISVYAQAAHYKEPITYDEQRLQQMAVLLKKA